MTHRGPFQPLPFCDSVILWSGSALLQLFRQTRYRWSLCCCILHKKWTNREGKISLTCMPGLVLGLFCLWFFWICCKPDLQPCEYCPLFQQGQDTNLRTSSEVIHICCALLMSRESWHGILLLGAFSAWWPTLHHQPELWRFTGKKQSVGQKDIFRSLIGE